MSHYVHHVPGRLRVKTPTLKRNEAEAARVRRLLAEFKGVLTHDVKTLTGSITIYYDMALTEAHTILAVLKEQGFIGGTTALVQPEPRVRAAFSPAAPSAPTTWGLSKDALSRFGSSLGEALGKVIFGLVLEKIAERSAIALIKAIL